eukprot:c8558_g1_i1 orf=157-453(+)
MKRALQGRQKGRIEKRLVAARRARVGSFKEANSFPFKDVLERLEQQSSRKVPFSTYASILRACCDARALPHGRRAHALLIARGLDQDHYLGNLLLLFY